MELKGIKPRAYQQAIFETTKKNNTLVVLPTGMGKTLIALMLAIERIQKFPTSKILFLAPTRPLVQQHLDYFKKHLPELYAQLDLFTGKVDSEKRKKIWQNAEIIFSTPQCVDGTTIIFTKDGPISIKDFFKKFKFMPCSYGNKKGYVANINEDILGYKNKKIEFIKAKKAWKLPCDKVIEIETELKNKLTCTLEHPLLTINPKGNLIWKEAYKYKKGEFVASSKQIYLKENKINLYKLIKNSKLRIANKDFINKLLSLLKKNKKKLNIRLGKYTRFKWNYMPFNLFLNLAKRVKIFLPAKIELTDWQSRSKKIILQKYLDSRLSYILGAMLGDGHLGARVGHGSEVVFSDLDSKKIREKFKKTLYETFRILMKDDKQKGLICYSTALSEILYKLGIPKGRKAKNIKVPKFIFFSSIDCITSFIKGIFDTDGNASKYSIQISSVSEKFIEEIKWLFLKIGILGSIEVGYSKGIINGRKIKKTKIYTFRFSGRRQLEKFLKMCKPELSKCKKLIKTLKNTKRPYTRAKEIIPVTELLKDIYAKNKEKLPRYLFNCLSIDNLNKISNEINCKETNQLKELLNLPIRWTRITKIRKIRKNIEVFDLTVEKEHNFITNCVISHNTVANDLKAMRYDLSEVSLLIEDECHRCLKNYAYKYVVDKYIEQSKFPRVLGLTASPGHEKARINEICKNLNIEAVEVRTRESVDVKPYIQELKFEIIKLDFPTELDEIRKPLKNIFDKKVEELKKRKLLFKPATKKYLLETQSRIMKAISTGNRHFNILSGASACAIAIKLQHALELLETQTLSSLQNYIHDLFDQAKLKKSRAVSQLIKQPGFNSAYIKLTELITRKIENPKLAKLKEIIKEEFSKNPKAKILVFSQYRDTVTRICKEINSLGISAKVFVGQAKKSRGQEYTGLSQREQQEIIHDFSLGKIKVMVATQVAEEGLDIPELDVVIFYDNVPSVIRKIQRAGRTARLRPGKLIILIVKGTRDESYYWAAFSREKKMHRIINGIKENSSNKKERQNKEKNKQKTLF